jgi:endonuclease-3 related protein
MATLFDAFSAVHGALVERFGTPDRTPEPAEPFQGTCRVLLAQSLSPPKVAATLELLRGLDLLAPQRLAAAAVVEVMDAAAEKRVPVSTKAIAPLKRFASWLVENYHGRIADLFDPHRSTERLHDELAAIKGIGPAAADAILLYALKRPAFPLDRATFRVLVRHGWLEPTATYDQARDLVVDCARSHGGIREERGLPENGTTLSALIEIAHGMDRLGRDFCRPAQPHCEHCPLVSLTPEGGIRQVDE